MSPPMFPPVGAAEVFSAQECPPERHRALSAPRGATPAARSGPEADPVSLQKIIYAVGIPWPPAAPFAAQTMWADVNAPS